MGHNPGRRRAKKKIRIVYVRLDTTEDGAIRSMARNDGTSISDFLRKLVRAEVVNRQAHAELAAMAATASAVQS